MNLECLFLTCPVAKSIVFLLQLYSTNLNLQILIIPHLINSRRISLGDFIPGIL